MQEISLLKDAKTNEYVSPLSENKTRPFVWNKKIRRTGVIAKKIGVYPLWTKKGHRVQTTLLQVSYNNFNIHTYLDSLNVLYLSNDHINFSDCG